MTNIISYDDGEVTVNEDVIGSVKYGNWTIFDDRTSFYNHTPFHLTKSEHRLLESLILHGGAVRTKLDLLGYLETDANYKIVDVLFCKMKGKIQATLPKAAAELKTIWGRGYACVREGRTGPPLSPVIPEGLLITHSCPDRWTPGLKNKMIKGIREGRIDRDNFLFLNSMADDELRQWEAGMTKITDLQQ